MEDLLKQKQANPRGLSILLIGTSILILLVIIKKYPKVPPLPKLYELNSFSLINQDNIPFGSQNMKNKWYVVNFVFTSCPMSCPKIMQTMAQLQSLIKKDKLKLHLVTFSVDPEIDTPKVLSKYSLKYQADNTMWNFLTGELNIIKSLLMKNFKVAMGEKNISDLMSIAHSNKLVLVDGDGVIRSYYPAETVGIKRLIADYKNNL